MTTNAAAAIASTRHCLAPLGFAACEQAVSLDDRDSFNLFALGRICTIDGQHDRAIIALEKSIALNPNSANAHYGLGWAYYWNGAAAIAIPYLDRAMALRGNLADGGHTPYLAFSFD